MDKTKKDLRVQNQRITFQQTIDYLATPPPAIKLASWAHFNHLVGGFRMREFSILCGPTGCGKTTFLANISAQLACQKVKHFVMSIETGHLDYMARVLSVWDERDYNTGEAINPKDLAALSARHMDRIEENIIEFSLYETRLDLEQLKYQIIHAVDDLGCRIIFIDNLNFLLKVTRAQDTILEMDRVIHDLIEFVKKVECHIVMVMHPRKTEQGRVVSEFDIKGSSTSVQEAQNVFLLNRPTPERIKEEKALWQDRELLLAKMRRRGIFVGRTICLKNRNTAWIEDGVR